MSSLRIIINYDWLLIPPPMLIKKVSVIVIQLVINNSFMYVYFSRSITNLLTRTTNVLCIPIDCAKIGLVPSELKTIAC